MDPATFGWLLLVGGWGRCTHILDSSTIFAIVWGVYVVRIWTQSFLSWLGWGCGVYCQDFGPSQYWFKVVGGGCAYHGLRHQFCLVMWCVCRSILDSSSLFVCVASTTLLAQVRLSVSAMGQLFAWYAGRPLPWLLCCGAQAVMWTCVLWRTG